VSFHLKYPVLALTKPPFFPAERRKTGFTDGFRQGIFVK